MIKAVALFAILVLGVAALHANPIIDLTAPPPPPPKSQVPPLALIALVPLAVETLVVASVTAGAVGFLFPRTYLVWLTITVLTWLPSSLLLRGVAISGPRWTAIALYEIAVCLVEAGLLFLLARAALLRSPANTMKLRPGMALIISTAGNLASFATGFLILGLLNGLDGPSPIP